MKGAKGLYFGANNAALVPVDVAVAVKKVGAKGPYSRKTRRQRQRERDQTKV